MVNRLALLSCAYLRNEIFKLFLQSIPKDIYTVIVGDESNKKSFLQHGTNGKYLEYPNNPIGAKWNYGLSVLKNVEFDYLIISGSDDVFSQDLWDWYKTLDVHYAGVLDFYFMDWQTKRIKYNEGFRANRIGEPHGAGRALHRNVLDALQWKLWDDDLNIGLDGSMTEKLKLLKGLTSKFIRLEQHGFIALDIKTDENLHSINEYPGHFVNPEPVLNRLGWTLR